MPSQLADALSWTGERLLTASALAALVVAVCWAACRWARVSPALRAWAWWLVSLKLVLTLAPVPAWPVAVLPANLLPSITARATDAMDRARGVVGIVQDDTTVAVPEPSPPASPTPADVSWLMLLAALWLGVVILHGRRVVRTALALRGIVRRSTALSPDEMAIVASMARALNLSRVPRVRVSPDVPVPQVVGLASPTVLVPAAAAGNLASQDWRMALGHELEHVRRRDVILGCVPALAERLFFFHPLARVASREYVVAREAACDAAVVRALGVPADDYGRLLVRMGVIRSESMLVASSASASASSLGRRLEMLQQPSSQSTPRILSWGLAAVAILSLAPLQLVARTSPVEPATSARVAQLPPAPPALPPAPPASIPPSAPAPPRAVAQAVPAPPAPPAPPGPVAEVAPAPPAPPAQAAQPARPAPPAPPAPPRPPSGDEVVLRLQRPTTEQQAMENMLRVLRTQLEQVEALRSAQNSLTPANLEALEGTRRLLEALMTTIKVTRTDADGARIALNKQMERLVQEREALARQQQEIARRLEALSRETERMREKLNEQAERPAGRRF